MDLLEILYHHVPSITTYPVYFGDIDALLMPYWDESWTPDRLDRIITRLWRFLDRTIPDAFAHANVGPTDNPVARSVLRVDRPRPGSPESHAEVESRKPNRGVAPSPPPRESLRR